jgi:uncharacterized protein
MNKKKIFNDPVYGFITLPDEIIYDLIEHPYFQRLRRIRQLGLAHVVYPGALHTRFHHALGALHLMTQSVDTLRTKGHAISAEEAQAVYIAILLHDLGHAPFSHALENNFVGVNHEKISLLFMETLNKEFNNGLSLAIRIFKNEYPKKFLYQLVSSQLDMDRLDYLNRDSFYTGVLEGKIGAQRIIKMLGLHQDSLVIEEKGIYSIEKFIMARRLMYWQVYLHKTVLGAEQLLVKIMQRAKELTLAGEKLFASPALEFFLKNSVSETDFAEGKILDTYALLDDYDIYSALKVWATHKDVILSRLCNGMVNRRLYKIYIQKETIDASVIAEKTRKAMKIFSVSEKEAEYFVFNGTISNSAYNPAEEEIKILFKDGNLSTLTEVSEQMDVAVLSRPVLKNYFCFMEEIN